MRRLAGSLWDGVKWVGRGLAVALMIIGAVFVVAPIATLCDIVAWLYRRVGAANRSFIGMVALQSLICYGFVTEFPDYAVLSVKALAAVLLPSIFYVIVRYGFGRTQVLEELKSKPYALLGLVALYAALAAVGFMAIP